MRGQPLRISICLNNVNHQTGCGKASLQDSQSIDSHDLDSQNIPRNILLYKEPRHVRTQRADVPTAAQGFDSWPLWPSKVPILLHCQVESYVKILKSCKDSGVRKQNAVRQIHQFTENFNLETISDCRLIKANLLKKNIKCLPEPNKSVLAKEHCFAK